MKKGNVILIALVIVMLIIIVINALNKKVDDNRKNDNPKSNENFSEYEAERKELYGEKSLYSEFNENGERVNTSEEMKKEQIIEDGVKIKCFDIVYKDNYTSITANVVNESNEEKGGYFVNLILLNDSGDELVTLKAYLNRLLPKSEGIITTGVSADIADVYKCEIKK